MLLVENEIDKRKGEKKELEEKQAALQEEIKTISAHSKKREYSQLLKREKENQTFSEQLLEVFSGKIPSNEAIQGNAEIAISLSSLEQQQKDNSVTEMERAEFRELAEFFGSMPPTDSELEECGDNILFIRQQTQELEKNCLSSAELKEFESLTAQYEYYRPTAEELDAYIDNYNQVSMLREEISNGKTLLAEQQGIQQQIPPKSVWKPALILIGILLLVLGCGAFILSINVVVGVIFVVIGIVVLLSGLLN